MQPPILPSTAKANTQGHSNNKPILATLESPRQGKGKDSYRRKEACLNCRSRKMRCGGEQPSCQTCLKWNRTCGYSAEGPRSSGPRPAAVLSAYLAGLEEKFQAMLPSRSAKPAATPTITRPNTSSPQSSAALGGCSLPKPTTLNSKHADIEFSLEDRERIFTIFFQYHHRVGCSIVSSHFFQSMAAEDENLRPHPGLVDVVLLVGIMIAGLTMQTHSLSATVPEATSLLPQIHRKLRKSLELVDRVLDYLEASLLLCLWYNYHNRLQEAQYLASSCFSIAVDLRLHQISGEVVRDDLNTGASSNFWDGTILGPPRDHYEIYLRIATFWHAYTCERAMGLITGLPTACDSIAIATIWPRSENELDSICVSIQEGRFSPKNLHSIHELLAGEVEPRPTDDRFALPIEWKTMVLLGRVAELTILTESLGTDDYPKLRDIIQNINFFANAIQTFDSTLSQIDHYLPPHQPLKSNPNARRWCIALPTRMGMCASHVHLLRSVEAALKLLTASTVEDKMNGLDAQARATFMELVPKDGSSFLGARFAFARTGIELAYEVARQNVEDDPEGFETTRWLTHLPYMTGYMLPPMLLAVVESIHDLESQNHVHSTDPLGHQLVSVKLEDAEDIFTKGVKLLHLLSNHLAVLRFQIAKIEEARHPTATSES